MKKTLIAASIALCSTTAFAGNNHDSCNINIDGQVSLIDEVLTITTEDKDVIRIEAGEVVYVNGDEVLLNAEQQNWMSSYYDGIYSAVPAVADIALDGVAIASTAVTEVFGNLLGTDSSAVDNINDKLDEIKDKIQYNFYAEDGSIRLDSTHFSDGEVFGPQWENEFEEAIEEVVMSSIGHLLVAIGTKMMFNGGDTDSFEANMEDFAADIEQRIESQAEELEIKADALCSQLAGVDYVENNLQASVKELSGLNIISIDSHGKKLK
ncbi:MAG: hypothetical protein Alis3KO_14940 [Aliiglaciecola sp.]|uniref:DUF2884 family protein n=1 Tax=Aliiglaciecola sp. M165 TaxID=2593649 RepID=UPI00117FA909|nr:DUF2884 family protein [Aliiglaciecola sp. M165]TRY32825.1 DUF2884 family protein [Aliiglaciecola sp. M165]